jgi:uroporphyrinogen-III decarboxylase
MIPGVRVRAIRDLMDRYLEIVNSPRNLQNASLWKEHSGWNRDKPRGFVPSRSGGRVPFVVELDISLWRKLTGNTNLIDYYSDPYTHMEFQLLRNLKHYAMYRDNYVYTDELYIWFGVITELSLFGSEVEWQEHKEGWIKGPVLQSLDDIQRLRPPDFYTSGLMPRVHEFYEVMNEVADGRMKVMFPELARGPFCMAVHLRGISDLFCEVLTDPESVHRLMRFIVDAEKAWTAERSRFTGEEPSRIKLFNDEIDCPSIGPKIYDDLIFPYEKELADEYGGVRYWHSCGNITAFLPAINNLPNLDVVHIGPWTSYEEADLIFGDSTALEICLHPVNDVVMATETRMRAKLEDIVKKCPHGNFSVRADALMPQGDDLEAQLEKIKMWESLALEYFGGDSN